MWIEDLKPGYFLVDKEVHQFKDDLYRLNEDDLNEINKISIKYNRAPITFDRLQSVLGFLKMGPTNNPNSNYIFQIMLIGHGWFKVYSHFGTTAFSLIHDKDNINFSDEGEPVKYIDELQPKIYELSGILIGRG